MQITFQSQSKEHEFGPLPVIADQFIVPRKEEFATFEDKIYQVTNVVHKLKYHPDAGPTQQSIIVRVKEVTE